MSRNRRLSHGLPECLPGPEDWRTGGGLHRQDLERLQERRPQAPHDARNRRHLERTGHGRSCRLLRRRCTKVRSGMSTAPKRPPPVHAFLLAVALCAALACTTTTLAGDGPEGNKPVTPETPRLAGQQFDYLVQALTEYRKGTRDNAVMTAMAKPLTEKQVRELAWYFSRQQGLTTKR